MNMQEAILNIVKDLTEKGYDFLISNSKLPGEQLTLIIINTDGTLEETPLRGWQLSDILNIVHTHKLDAQSILADNSAISFKLTTLEDSFNY